MNKLSLYLLIFSCLLSPTAMSVELPEKLDLVYRAKVAGMNIGTLNRSLRSLQSGRYTVTSETNATGIAAVLLKDTYRETSDFKVEKDMIYPLKYMTPFKRII